MSGHELSGTNGSLTRTPAAERLGPCVVRPQTEVCVIAGTRPEVLKLASVVNALRAFPDVKVRLLTTGQHRELLDAALGAVALTPDERLNSLRDNQPLGSLVARMLADVSESLRNHRPDAVIVQGDTATAYASAVAAFLERIPVFHVEAGLRTLVLEEPFPEEAFRQMIGRLATAHFAPTPSARQALLREGIPPAAVYVTGNTIVDALESLAARIAEKPTPSQLHDVPFDSLRVVLLTVHRRENHDKLAVLLSQLRQSLESFEDIAFLVIRHPNPAVSTALDHFYDLLPKDLINRLWIVNALPYEDILWAMSRSWIIATDSGGLQEEAPSFKKFVLVLRNSTERPEGIEARMALVTGASLFSGIKTLYRKGVRWPEKSINPYGDGLAGQRIGQIVRAILHGDSIALSAGEV